MASSLSNLHNNLSEEIHRINCKDRRDDKKCETCGITYMYCNCFFEYTGFKVDLSEYKCLCFNKNYQYKFDEELKERFLTHTVFLTTPIMSLFHCCEKVFIIFNIWMIGKNSMKHHYLNIYIYIYFFFTVT